MTDLKHTTRECLLSEIRKVVTGQIREERKLNGDLVLYVGDPSEVIVRISGGRVSIAVFSIRWDGPSTTTVLPEQLGSICWKSLPLSRTIVIANILIEAAREIRRAKYSTCQRCGEINPPEWMHDKTTCQSCSERYLGVVY